MHISYMNQGNFPASLEQIRDNRIFGMYHSNTAHHNKEIILQSMLKKKHGIVRVVFATMALGLGVNFAGLSTAILTMVLLEVPTTISRRVVGRDSKQATSTICWIPANAPLHCDSNNPHNTEIVAVRRYLENSSTCRRFQIIFIPLLQTIYPNVTQSQVVIYVNLLIPLKF